MDPRKDPALPPGGLDQIFRQYERIKRNGLRDDGPPPWEPEPDQMPARQPAPKTSPQADVKDMSRPTPQQPAPPQKPPEEEITDAEGLRRAYSSPDRLYKHGDRLYIAGTTWEDPKMDVSRPPWYTILLKGLFPQEIPDDFSLNDAVDDLKIPEFKTRDIERYRDAKKFLQAHPEVKQLIGHSMGSSVALQLNADFRNRFETRTYAAPVFHLLPGSDSSDPKDQRFRTFGDPVAMFDNAASETVVKPTLNPLELHSYNNFGDVGLSPGTRQGRKR
jgi:hypothetical protein